MLLEDRKSREAQFEEKRQRQQRVVEEERLRQQRVAEERLRQQRVAEERLRQQRVAEERLRQQRVAEEEKALMREQMEMLTRLVGESRQVEETRTNVSQGSTEGEAKLVKLAVQDDIESYLITFERVMRAYEVKENWRAVKSAPQLTGKAQQAYAGHEGRGCWNISVVEEGHPVLRRYDYSDETYRQRFREAAKKEDETVKAANMADNYMCGPETETRPGAEVGRESTRKHGYETMAKRSARQRKKERLPSTVPSEREKIYFGPKGDTGSGGDHMLQLWHKGTDVPELGRLLSQASERAEVFMATTRAQVKKEAKAERDSLVKELRSGVRPNPILLNEPQEETWNLGEELNDTIVHCGRS
ncbi:hypothetical protein EMCRGX_G016883 [Ephydatia muelleri]